MTKKIGVKGITCTLLATFLFLSVDPSLVMAQDGKVCFYSNDVLCQGAAVCCGSLLANDCCKNLGGPNFGYAADISPGDKGYGDVYVDMTCDGTQYGGLGYSCIPGLSVITYSSGMWAVVDNGDDGAEPASEKPCTESLFTDTLEYKFITEDRRRASWVLPIASLTEADSNGPFRKLPAQEQLIWFKSRGATLEVEDHQTTEINAYSPAPGLTP